MDAFIDPGLWVAIQCALPPDAPVFLLVHYGINALMLGMPLRTLWIVVARVFGAYHPAHYRHWPRLPWRSLVGVWSSIKQWHERTFVMGKRATGGFSGSLSTLSQLYKPSQLLLGRATAFGVGLLQPVGTKVDTHAFMYAMTGAGKTVQLMTMIRCWIGSVSLIDPKGQVTKALALNDTRRWHVLDVYGITGLPSASFNAFDCIKDAVQRSGEASAVLWANRIASALIQTPAGSKTPYFSDTARGFLVGLILHVLSRHPEHEHNLPFVRDLIVHGYRVFENGQELTVGDEAHALLLDAMRKNPDYDGAVAGAAAALISAGDETAGNVRSTLQEQTKWLDLPAVRAITRSSSFVLSKLKEDDQDVVSLCAPVFPIRLELAPFCRLLTNMTAYTFEAVPQKKGQCLTVIDELPSQGHNETIEVMLAVARSYGQTFLGVAQNVELMKLAYPKSWGTFTGEAKAVYWMATNHDETARHLSQVLGKKTIVDKDRYTGRKSYRDIDVMTPDQVKRYLAPGSGNLIVTGAGLRPKRLKAEPYFKALPVWMYAADPDHREAWRRRITRALFVRTPSEPSQQTASTDLSNPSQEDA